MNALRERLVACLLSLSCAALASAQEEAREVRVKVLDHRGRPAVAVPVVAGSMSTIGSSMDFTRVPRSRQLTDKDGFARIPIAPRKQRPWANLHLQADVVAEPPLRVPIANGGDGDPLTITLPPMGQVRVIVYGPDERPLKGVRDVRLEVAGSKRFFDRLSVRGEREDEGSMFRWVALGLQLTVRAQIEGAGDLRVKRKGPTIAQQLVVFDVRANEQSIVRVWLVDKDGKPIANRRLVSCLAVGDRRRLADAKTDGDGRLVLPVPKQFAGKDGAEWQLCDPAANGAGVKFSLAEEFVGFRDLRGVRLEAGDVAMRGTVVDSDGQPMTGVEVRVPMSWTSGRFVGNASRSAQHVVRTDAQGVFEVREHAFREARVSASLGKGLFLAAPIVAFGDDAIELHALRAGKVVVVLPGVPPGCDATALQFRKRVWGPGGFGVVMDEHVTVPLADGVVAPQGHDVASAVVFEDLEHGTYDVQLGDLQRRKGMPSAIKVGEPDDDVGKVVTFDCLQHVVPVVPRLLRPDGVALEGSVMNYRVGSGGFSGRSLTVTKEARPVLVPAGNRLVFQHPKWRTVEVRELTERVDIQLQPRFDVTFALPAGVELPAGARFQAMPKAMSWLNSGTVTLSAVRGQPLTASVDAVGATIVSLAVPDNRGADYREIWSAEVDVPEPAGDEPIVVTLPIGDDDLSR